MKFNPSKWYVLQVKIPRAKEIASDYQLKGVTHRPTRKSNKFTLLGIQHQWEPKMGGDHISKIASKLGHFHTEFLEEEFKGMYVPQN